MSNKDKTVTLEEVEAAMEHIIHKDTADSIIEFLSRPAVEFEGEEVMVTETRGGNRFYRWREIAHLPPDSYMQKANRRKLTTKEAGAQGIIHGLEEMIRKLYPTHKGICEVGQKALDKWRQERGE